MPTDFLLIIVILIAKGIRISIPILEAGGPGLCSSLGTISVVLLHTEGAIRSVFDLIPIIITILIFVQVVLLP